LKFGDSFKDIDSLLARDYVNPNELMPMHNQLHACESLFGDWNARICLLMQDAADVDSLIKFHKQTGRPTLSHSPSASTNKRLVEWLSKVETFRHLDIEGHHSKTCGLYYANAVWYLKRKGGMSGVLRQRKRVIEKSRDILAQTIRQLENLELVLAFGEVAYISLQKIFTLELSWSEARKRSSLIPAQFERKRYHIGVTTHPMARGVSKDLMEARLQNILTQWQNLVAENN